ncbi:8229_t:CDS:2, partial [Dentiscutata erythropus]
TFEPFFTHNGHPTLTIIKPQTNSPNLPPTCNQTTTNPLPAKKYKKNTNDKDATKRNYSSATFPTTTSSLQLQKNFPILITKTNNGPDLTQINTTTDLQTQDYLGLLVTPQTDDIIMTKVNLLTIDNVAQLPNHNQSMDTQSNVTVKSLLPKSYARV